ncbi:MAG: HYR domain-containing protein [Planctomycetes bacterium]|nr:HYR domain-containing protein [Planctomycetota bacterium]
MSFKARLILASAAVSVLFVFMFVSRNLRAEHVGDAQSRAVDIEDTARSAAESSMGEPSSSAQHRAMAENPSCTPEAGSCDQANGTPGCDDSAYCNSVCDLDPYCCDVAWDALCVSPNEIVSGASRVERFDGGFFKYPGGSHGTVVEGGSENAMGAPSLTLEVPAGCLSDAQISVELWMRNITQVTGFQAFLEFDVLVLSYRGDLSTYTSIPFPLHMQAITTAEVSAGQLNLDGSVALGDPETTTDALLATLVFDVVADCGPTSIDFRTGGEFSSALSFEGNPLVTVLVNSPSLTLDDTIPTVTAPTTTELECSTDLPAAATTIAEFTTLTGAAASDNCGSLTVSSVAGALIGTECLGTITRTYTITDDCGNSTNVDHVFNVSDDTVPTVTAPTTTELECSTDLPAAATTIAEFTALTGAAASDNCGSLTVSSVTGGLIGTECLGTITRTYTITDGCGNSTNVDHVFNVSDDTVPAVTAPTTTELECSTDLPAAATTIAEFTALTGAAASDNCGSLTVSSVTGALSGTECLGTITRTYTITDDCGNSTNVDHVFNVSDDTVPVISGCPGNIEVSSDPGTCTAVVSWTAPTADDNCGLLSFTSTDNPGNTFPGGITTVTYTATDDCGQVSTCTFDVTVNGVVDVDVQVELAGVTDPATRCIHFVVDDCAETAVVELSFDAFGLATATIVVPCGTWTQLCAKDEQHTEWDTSTLTDAGTFYTADTLLSLAGGDTDNDGDVDINDVTLLLAQFGNSASAGGCPWDTVTRDADFSNNNIIGSEDYTFLTDNWLTFSSCNCTLGADGPGGSGGVLLTAISVEDLPADLGKRADLNKDGVVDYKDVRAFEQRNGLPNDLSSLMEASEKIGR